MWAPAINESLRRRVLAINEGLRVRALAVGTIRVRIASIAWFPEPGSRTLAYPGCGFWASGHSGCGFCPSTYLGFGFRQSTHLGFGLCPSMRPGCEFRPFGAFRVRISAVGAFRVRLLAIWGRFSRLNGRKPNPGSPDGQNANPHSCGRQGHVTLRSQRWPTHGPRPLPTTEHKPSFQRTIVAQGRTSPQASPNT